MRLGHIHLKVTDLRAAERFYCDVLGLKVQERVGESFLFLTYGDAHHDIALQEISGARPLHGRGPHADSPGLYHSAFEVASTVELVDVIDRLRRSAIPYSLVDHRISWAVYTHDPSGNGVEIYLDRRDAQGGSRSWNGRSAHLLEEFLRAQSRGE